MRSETKSMHITPAEGNVFADLGFDSEEATALKTKSQGIIIKTLDIRNALMTELAGWIEARNLKPAEAAKNLGVIHLRVSDVINKKASNFTIDALVDMLARAGVVTLESYEYTKVSGIAPRNIFGHGRRVVHQ